MAQTTTATARPALEISRSCAARNVAFFMLVALALVVVFLAARRLAGALVEPLETLPLLLAGLTAAAVSLAIRVAWQPRQRRPASWHDHLLRFGPLVCCLVLATTLWLPDSPVAGVTLLWAVLAAEEAWSIRPSAWQQPGSNVYEPRPLNPVSVRELPPLEMEPVTDAIEELPETEPPRTFDSDDADLVQRFTRTRTPEGVDSLQGQMRGRLSMGQVRTSIHVAFCPPFEKVPEFDFEQIDGPEARVSLGQLLPYGVRLDVKLREAAEEPTAVMVEIFATCGE